MKFVRLLLVSLAVGVLFGVASSAWAQVGTLREDTYDVTFDAGAPTSWSGTGYNGGQWYDYNSGWINVWFYNDPWDPGRQKWIEVGMELYAYFPIDDLEIIWGASTAAWSDFGLSRPPLPEDFQSTGMLYGQPEDLYINRTLPGNLIFTGSVQPGPVVIDTIYREILDENPEWVFIDIWIEDLDMFDLYGYIDHQCIPEPMTLSLLGLGLLGVLRRRRRE